MKIRGLCNRGEFLGKLRKYEGVMADCAQLVGEMQIIYFAEIFSPGNLPAHPVYILLEIYPHILYIFCWKFTRTSCIYSAGNLPAHLYIFYIYSAGNLPAHPVYILYIFCWKFTRTLCIYSAGNLPAHLYLFCIYSAGNLPAHPVYIYCAQYRFTAVLRHLSH